MGQLFCEKCGVHVRGGAPECPLCQRPLSGEAGAGEPVFPRLFAAERPYHFFLRAMIFGAVAAAVVCVAVNAMFFSGGWWSLFVVAGIACAALTLAIALFKRGNLLKTLLWQLVAMSVLALFWDRWTGWHAWSLDYVLPILCIVVMGAMLVIARLQRLELSFYLIYLVIDALLGIVPLVFLLAGWVRVSYPSIICVTASVISLAALLSFEWENMRAEIKKRLHM